jgi:hypothetical protein
MTETAEQQNTFARSSMLVVGARQHLCERSRTYSLAHQNSFACPPRSQESEKR